MWVCVCGVGGGGGRLGSGGGGGLGRQIRFCSIAVSGNLAARRCTNSNLYKSIAVWGTTQLKHYSKWGQTRILCGVWWHISATR